MTITSTQVISWNITQRCNLKCEHCYIDAKMLKRDQGDPLPDEMTTEECLAVVDQIALFAPEALLILTGGEPLLRRDIFEITTAAAKRSLWVVIGTNGMLIHSKLAGHLRERGIKGIGLSIDSTEAERHDRFRGIPGAWKNTVQGASNLASIGFPFLVQTTVSRENFNEIEKIARLALELGAKVFNLYFLVPTGRGRHTSNITPQDYEAMMQRLLPLQEEYQGRMLINAKCAPHFQRVLYEDDPASPFIKGFEGTGGCPAGTQYCGIRPNGDMTPCPYLPVYGGNVREKSFGEIWEKSPIFQQIRNRGNLEDRCGLCEFNRMCGGCRARAFGETGDYMAEDSWCLYEPGQHGEETIVPKSAVIYGLAVEPRLAWTADAKVLLNSRPAFLRGYLLQQVEAFAMENEQEEVTDEVYRTAKRARLAHLESMVPSFWEGGIGDVLEGDQASSATDQPSWTKEAQERLHRIPRFVRPMAQKAIEAKAAESGATTIDSAFMQAVSEEIIPPFAKRLLRPKNDHNF